jgi:hypothetical protein
MASSGVTISRDTAVSAFSSAAHGPESWCQIGVEGRLKAGYAVLPVYNCFAVNNLDFCYFHSMEEVIGSIPIRSTNQFNNLEKQNAAFTGVVCGTPWRVWRLFSVVYAAA